MLPWLSGERFQPARLSSASGGRLYSGWRMRLRCWSSDMLLIRMSKRTGLVSDVDSLEELELDWSA